MKLNENKASFDAVMKSAISLGMNTPESSSNMSIWSWLIMAQTLAIEDAFSIHDTITRRIETPTILLVAMFICLTLSLVAVL